MAELPSAPVPASEFIERLLPALYEEVELDEYEAAIALRLGVVLRGEGGGEWTLRFVEGGLSVTTRRDPECDLTVVQQVADWRAAIWEGRPALVADLVEQLRREGIEAMRPPAPPGGGPRPDPLKGIADLRGLVEAVIEAGEGGEGHWRVAVLIGPGEVPDAPQATIRLAAAQAEAIRTGQLHPLEALITGELQLDGDLGLILQLQAVAMTLSMAAGSPR